MAAVSPREDGITVNPTIIQGAGVGSETVDDFLARDYLSVIRQFPDKETQEWLLRESVVTLVRVPDPRKKPPSAPVSDELPDELRHLNGSLVDLGFGKLELRQAEIERILLAFCGEGVGVPGTPYKLRHSVMSLFTFVEHAGGLEVMLPADWRRVVRSQSWIGKKVVDPNLDLSKYGDVGDGYALQREDLGCQEFQPLPQ